MNPISPICSWRGKMKVMHIFPTTRQSDLTGLRESVRFFAVGLVLLLSACASPAVPLSTTTPQATATPLMRATSTPANSTPAPEPTSTPESVSVFLRDDWPEIERLSEIMKSGGFTVVKDSGDAGAVVQIAPSSAADGDLLAQRFFAVVAPFATVRDDITLAELQERWSEEASLLVSEDAVGLVTLFGDDPAQTLSTSDLLAQLQQQPDALAIVPFDQLDPSLKVLAVDGINPLDNQLVPKTYSLALSLVLEGPDSGEVASHLQGILPATNRDPTRLTTLVMTGVTAMSRGTAARMESKGYTYPAAVISDTLRSADITHVSNEVPFIDGCEVNNTFMNLVLCSDYPYWQTLEAIGTDIVGLSGNHVNDFGREGARESLAFYRDNEIPIYGSGLNEDEACAPLRWEHNGNTFAFVAALAWWPEEAWATATEPGACYFYGNQNRILADIQALSEEVDVVAVELQYHETYEPSPIKEQVADFRMLRQAGADIVTGVQSHVPQAMEPYGNDAVFGPGMISFGLGNIFFDQMEDWDTRTGLIARHAIYGGRLISTEILTTVLEDYAQPRWATPEERAGILRKIFKGAPKRNDPTPEPTPSPTPATTPTALATATLTAQSEPTPEPTTKAESESDQISAVATLEAGSTPVSIHALAVEEVEPKVPHVGLPWPNPAEATTQRSWLARPTAPEHNQIPAATYAFGSTANGAYRIHHGADISNGMGTPLLAAESGVVVYAGPDDEMHVYGPYPDFYGRLALIQLDRTHLDQPMYTLYGHMQALSVESGQRVERGQQVGVTGMTGIAIGPHVHVEVRRGQPDYNQVYNPDLWLEPIPGLGTIAGRVVTPDGRAWHNTRLHLYRFENGGSRLFRIIDTYAEDEGLRPDPEYAENFVFADIPAGDYQLVLRLGDRTQRQNLRVDAGQITGAQFVVEP